MGVYCNFSLALSLVIPKTATRTAHPLRLSPPLPSYSRSIERVPPPSHSPFQIRAKHEECRQQKVPVLARARRTCPITEWPTNHPQAQMPRSSASWRPPWLAADRPIRCRAAKRAPLVPETGPLLPSAPAAAHLLESYRSVFHATTLASRLESDALSGRW
jgi:hypothetical protein